MNDSAISLRATADVWLATYTPTGAEDGAICLENGNGYAFKPKQLTDGITVKGYFDVSDYALDELMIRTSDVFAAVQAGFLTVVELA
jgi:hypothetical protein